jgi:RNA polymerase sigma-70 factor, ECF subfamily
MTDPVEVDERGEDFDAFYRDQFPRIVRLLYPLTGRQGVAEDLAQESLMSAHQRWGDLRTYDRPDLWLRRVAVNRAISRRRRTQREIVGHLRLAHEPVGSIVLSESDEHLWGLVRRLPRRQAAAIVLWSVVGHTYAEIGEILECGEETARTHVRRAKSALAAALDEEDAT